MSITITIGGTSKVFNKQQLIDNCDYFKVLYENCIDNTDELKFNGFKEEALEAFYDKQNIDIILLADRIKLIGQVE
jgi:hypothetical protein